MIIKNSAEISDQRIFVVMGHAGSGKTEFSVNMAFLLQREGKNVTVADLDVVNPYFRSRECKEIFAENGIDLIHSSPACRDADIPTMAPEVKRLFDDSSVTGVMDIGGDPTGARVLGQYRNQIRRVNGRVFCILNAARPFTDTAEKCLQYIRAMEAASGLEITGLINNTHLCGETTLDDVKEGIKLARETEKISGIPYVCSIIREELVNKENLDFLNNAEDRFLPVHIYMKKPWE